MGRGIKLPNDGLPMPIMPTENIGIMSGAIRKPRAAVRKDKFNFDKRGSRRGVKGGMMQVTMKDPKTGRMYGGLVKDGVPQFKKPDFMKILIRVFQNLKKHLEMLQINLDLIQVNLVLYKKQQE